MKQPELKDLAVQRRRAVIKCMQTCNHIIIASVLTFVLIAVVIALSFTVDIGKYPQANPNPEKIQSIMDKF